jgi:hypothetical protein
MDEEIGESEVSNVKERIAALEDRVREGERSPGKKDREAHVRIDELEKDIAKDKAESLSGTLKAKKESRMQRTLKRIWRRNWREPWNR